MGSQPSNLHVDREDSIQTAEMRRLIWVFNVRTFCLLCCAPANSPVGKSWLPVHVFSASETASGTLAQPLQWLGRTILNRQYRTEKKKKKKKKIQCGLLWTVPNMSHVTSKPVFGVCDQLRLKPACSVSEASYSLEMFDWSSIEYWYYTI